MGHIDKMEREVYEEPKMELDRMIKEIDNLNIELKNIMNNLSVQNSTKSEKLEDKISDFCRVLTECSDYLEDKRGTLEIL